MDIIEQIEALDAKASEAAADVLAQKTDSWDATNALRDQIRDLILDELDYGFNDEVKSLLWSKAYQIGHSGGYTEILSVGYDLAELLRDAIKASK